jgi:hypothetical protein
LGLRVKRVRGVSFACLKRFFISVKDIFFQVPIGKAKKGKAKKTKITQAYKAKLF